METEIITIGDELLIGQIADTNSQWVATIASENGFHINRITSISDNLDTILRTLREAANRSALVFITGGLGPTNDDVTHRAISEFFQTDWKLNQQVYEDIRQFLSKRGIEMSELNAEQAKVPVKADIYYNTIGTAPGMKLKGNNTIYIFMPGVQFEMTEMLRNSIIPELKKQYIKEEFLYKIVITQGIPEAYLASKLKDWERSLPENIDVAYLPSPGIVKLRISGKGDDFQNIENKIDNSIENLKKIIPEYYVATSKLPLEEILGETLKNHHSTISTAESCTGGTVAKRLTSISGSSNYFEGSVVAYSNKIKQQILGVSSDIINAYGAVSKEVVEEMAKGVQKLFGTDYAISISGIAGPAGGTKDKPVGTTWIALSDGEEVIAEKYLFGNKRDVNIEKASNTAMGMIQKMILKKS